MSKQINIRLDPTTYNWIHKQAKQEAIPVAAMTRRLVARAANQEQETQKLAQVAALAADRVAQTVLLKLEELTEE